ncbi:MAG: hypothetical protein V1833_02720 [Elusimicrobiota bacterium]
MKFRKNIRLKNYDYKTNGYYFVTIVTHNRLPLLCIGGSTSVCCSGGSTSVCCSGGCKSAIVECIKKLPEFISGVSIDWFVVMDNHIHIIFVLEDCSRTLGRVVAAMKSAITKIVTVNGNSLPQQQADLHLPQQQADLHLPQQQADLHLPQQQLQQAIWQSNYYEHIIRNEKALDKIRKYIENNPDIEKPDWEKLDK